MMRFFRTCICAVIALVLMTELGCKKNEVENVMLAETSVKEAVAVANPQGAIDKIYSSLEEYSANPVSDWQLEELFEITEDDVEEYYGKISDPAGGLADVLILRSKPGKLEDVQLALSKYKEKRMAEFENYDILDAYPISQNAVIYDQGDYTIMLMMADNESARKVIDEYIPL